MEKIDLNKIYKRKKSDRDIFQELMPFKVKEILLIANYYDSYTCLLYTSNFQLSIVLPTHKIKRMVG